MAGSMGPTGHLVEPFGLLTRDRCLAAFSEQASALVDGGVDLLVLETFFALDEALWAAEAIGAVTDLPLVMSFSFDQGTRTMMGLSPADVTTATSVLGLAALGANCGRSLDDTAQLVSEFLAAGLSSPRWVTGAVNRFDPASNQGTVLGGWTRDGQGLAGAVCGVTASAAVFHSGRPACINSGYASVSDPISGLMNELGSQSGVAARSSSPASSGHGRRRL